MRENSLKIGNSEVELIVSNIEKSDSIGRSHLIDQLKETGKISLVLDNLDKFKDIAHKEIFLKIALNGGLSHLADYITKFKGLDKEAAWAVVGNDHNYDQRDPYLIFRNPEVFEGFEFDKKIYDAVFSNEYYERLAEYLDQFNFEGLNYNDLVNKLIEKKKVPTLLGNLKKFKNIDQKKLVSRLIEKGHAALVANYVINFNKELHQMIADKVVEVGQGESVAQYLHYFEDVDQKALVLKMIEKGDRDAICAILENLFIKKLDKEIAFKMFEKGIFFGEDNLKSFDIDKSFFEDKKILEYAKAGLLIAIRDNNKVQYFLHHFNFQDLTMDDVRSTGVCIDLYLNAFRAVNPDVVKSFETTSGIISFINLITNVSLEDIEKTIKENPEIIDALLLNPGEGHRLMNKFPSFDELSKDNIKTLIAIHKEAKEAGLIDDESPEYLKFVNDKLASYKNNAETLISMEEAGVNKEVWLNYSKREDLLLNREGDKQSFEALLSPIDRTLDYFTKFTNNLSKVLGSKKAVLKDILINKNTEGYEEKQAKISKMKEVYEKLKVDNPKKAEGMLKAINALENSNKEESKVGLYLKYTSEIAKLKADIENFKRDDKKLKEALERLRNGKAENKDYVIIKTLPESLKRDVLKFKGTLDKFSDNFKLDLTTQKEGIYLYSEIYIEANEDLGEEFVHLTSDLEMMADLNKNRGRYDNEHLSIYIAKRNVSHDLYLGNDTNCCISIDNDYHQNGRSPISDYLTDPAMSMVKVVDDKGRAVYVAWCYISKNKDGEPILVADNIEADTSYSGYYDQLYSQMTSYLKEYAEKAGLKEVYLGISNNDIETSTLRSLIQVTHKSDLGKMGEYNRSSGYYLEANSAGAFIIP